MLRPAHARLAAVCALAMALSFAAASAVLSFVGYRELSATYASFATDAPTNPGSAAGLIGLAKLASTGAAVAAFVAAGAMLLAAALAWRAGDGRRELVLAPALAVVALLLAALLPIYTGATYPVAPLSKIPILLLLGGALGAAVLRSRAALWTTGAGTLALVGGALHAHAYGPFWAHPLGALHPVALEAAWAAAGFALLVCALALATASVRRTSSTRP